MKICPRCTANREAKVKGVCMACYMRIRRAAAKTGPRRRNGETIAQLLAARDQSWQDKLQGRTIKGSGKDACHEWTGPTSKGGYGVVHIGLHTVLVHRLVHALQTGNALAEVVMHMCDNPRCCNPDHLRAGTHQENMDDMWRKGRGPKPEQLGKHLRNRCTHPKAKRVKTPQGVYASSALAAEDLKMEHRTVSRWASKETNGFSYV
jgi:hypothetical protein